MSVLEIASADYHADLVADRPALSKSIIHTLIESSPAHARAAHPKLNPFFKRQEEDKFDRGTAAHSLILEGDNGVFVVQANDWRTKDAKEAREWARSVGKVPLLGKHWDEVQEMAVAVTEQLSVFDASPELFAAGKPERTLVWEENGVTCKARLDWLRDDLRCIDDLKTTSAKAAAETYQRTLFSIGGDVQASFYLRGFRSVFPDAPVPRFRFVVVETAAPYALSVFDLDEDVLTLAHEKVEWAIDTWRGCLERDEWPGYPTQVCTIGLNIWEESRWFDRQKRKAA